MSCFQGKNSDIGGSSPDSTKKARSLAEVTDESSQRFVGFLQASTQRFVNVIWVR
jgi:hypothetical protein